MMIPPDIASRQQASADLMLKPVSPVQEITDRLSGFTVGQRLMAEVQSMLPNGTYRAMVNQRNITLALPFSAKSGDSLELEVTESEGRLALAVIAKREGDGTGAGKESVSSTLSRTGQLISLLFSGAKGAEKEAQALPLNGNRPIAETPPGKAQDILPQLKEAIARSGMFYESHQAEWVEGRLAKLTLMQEPQGKLSTSPQPEAEAAATARGSAPPADTQAGRAGPLPAQAAGQEAAAAKDSAAALNTAALQKGAAGEANPQNTGQIVASQLQGIVHHQLEALANQTFVWQGQIWPGQEMRWEIEEDGQNQQDEEDAAAQGWRTRLDLSFPGLGGISARLQLLGDQVSLSLDVDTEASLGIMRSDAETLRRRLDDAGLSLASLGIAPAERESTAKT
jgi:hypothetical protein